MPAARSEGRAQSCVGQLRQGNRLETRIADAASSVNTGPVTAVSGTAEYTAVPPSTWRMTPTQLRASHPASRRLQLGLDARGSSVSSRITARVAAVPPASAVKTTPPASTAAIAEATARSETAVSGHVPGSSGSRTPAGTPDLA